MFKLIIFPVFVLIFGLLYFMIKAKINEGILKVRLEMEQKKNEKNEKKAESKKKDDSKVQEDSIQNIELTISDKKMMSKIFKKKVSRFIYIKNISVYEFFYRQGDMFQNKINKDFEVIKVSLKKIKISEKVFYSIDIMAWNTKYDFENKKAPVNKIENVLSSEGNLNDQVEITFKDFFKPVKIKSYEKTKIKTK